MIARRSTAATGGGRYAVMSFSSTHEKPSQTWFRAGTVWRSQAVESAVTMACPFGSDHTAPGTHGLGFGSGALSILFWWVARSSDEVDRPWSLQYPTAWLRQTVPPNPSIEGW